MKMFKTGKGALFRGKPPWRSRLKREGFFNETVKIKVGFFFCTVFLSSGGKLCGKPRYCPRAFRLEVISRTAAAISGSVLIRSSTLRME